MVTPDRAALRSVAIRFLLPFHLDTPFSDPNNLAPDPPAPLGEQLGPDNELHGPYLVSDPTERYVVPHGRYLETGKPDPMTNSSSSPPANMPPWGSRLGSSQA